MTPLWHAAHKVEGDRDPSDSTKAPETLYSRWKRWSAKGIFALMMAGLARREDSRDDPRSGHCYAMPCRAVDATYLKAHRTATIMTAQKAGVVARFNTRWAHPKNAAEKGRTKAGMNPKLHAICDSQERPIELFVTSGQVSEYIGVRMLLSSLPNVKWPLGDRGYDADWFREALQD